MCKLKKSSGPRLVLFLLFLVLGKIKSIHRWHSEETDWVDGWLEQIVWLLFTSPSWARVGRYAYARSHAGTSTVTCTDVELTLLFAHAGSCSTQISRQWTFPFSLAYFDLKHVVSVSETQRQWKGATSLTLRWRYEEQIQPVGLCWWHPAV